MLLVGVGVLIWEPPSSAFGETTASRWGVIKMMKLYKKGLLYFSKHPLHNAVVHVLCGMGIGMLLTYPMAGIHPVRWGVAFLALGILGHLWSAK